MSTPPQLTDSEAEEPLDEVDEYRMPLLDHLKELRSRMIRAFVALLVCGTVSVAFADQIISFLTAPAKAAGAQITILGPFEGVYAYLNAAVIGAAVLGSPFLAWEAWGFVAPGLYKTERRVVLPLTVSSTILFLLGGAFAYYAIFPAAFPFFFSVIEGVDQVILSVATYMSAVLRMMLVFGLCFQLPVGSFFLARVGLIDHRDMLGSFRYAIVAIFLVAAIITPPDVLTQGLLAVPLVTLYGIGVVIAWAFSTKVRPESDEAPG